MTNESTPIDAVFRIDKKDGDCIAVWRDNDAFDGLMIYAHIGQHGECAIAYYRDNTRPAKPGEYESLLTELEFIGYKVNVRKRLRWN